MKSKLKKKSILPKHIYDEVYRVNMYIFDNHTPEEVNRYLKKRFNLDSISFDNVQGKTWIFESNSKPSIELFAMWALDGNDRSTIVHECFHMVHNILDSRGFKLCDDNEEAYAYYLEYLYRKIIE